jgi:hypothetical protein
MTQVGYVIHATGAIRGCRFTAKTCRGYPDGWPAVVASLKGASWRASADSYPLTNNRVALVVVDSTQCDAKKDKRVEFPIYCAHSAC